MAELATLARPYAEALFEVAKKFDLKQAQAEVEALAAVAADPALRSFADRPKASPAQVFDLIASVVGMPLGEASKNLLRMLIENGRLPVLPDVAAQFHALVAERSGISDATVYSAFPIEPDALADLVTSLERRFERKLSAQVVVEPALIGGVRVVVGDEVLDTSVKARLERMKAALTA